MPSMVSAPAGSIVAGPVGVSSDGLYHWSDGSTSTSSTYSSPAPTPTPAPAPTPTTPTYYDAYGNPWTGRVYQDEYGGAKGIYDPGTAPAGSTRGYTEIYSTPTGGLEAERQRLAALKTMQDTGIVIGPMTPEYLTQQIAKQEDVLSNWQNPLTQPSPAVQTPPSSQTPQFPPSYFTTPTPNATSPSSGQNWRSTAMAGLSPEDVYGTISSFADTGGSLAAFERENLLNPGVGQAYYDTALNYAKQQGLPSPFLPSVSQSQAPYYQYGFNPGQAMYQRDIGGQSIVNPISAYLTQIYNQRAPATGTTDTTGMARGGSVQGFGGLGQLKLRGERYLRGGGGGQADDVPARLSDGEYVMDADVVSALGDGNNEAGARKLDQMRAKIRQHKRSAPASKIPPKAKHPEKYLKGA